MKTLILFVGLSIILAMADSTSSTNQLDEEYFPIGDTNYVVFCLPDTLVGHKISTDECGLNRAGHWVRNMDYRVIKCKKCWP